MLDSLRDPTAESAPIRRPRRSKLANLDGKVVALLDIGKMRGNEFLDQLESRFTQSGLITKRYRKPTNTRVAPVGLLQKIASESHAVILALSD